MQEIQLMESKMDLPFISYLPIGLLTNNGVLKYFLPLHNVHFRHIADANTQQLFSCFMTVPQVNKSVWKIKFLCRLNFELAPIPA